MHVFVSSRLAPTPSNFVLTFGQPGRLRMLLDPALVEEGVGVALDEYKPIMERLKLSGNLREYSAILSEPHKGEDGKQQQQQQHLQKLSSKDREAMESLLANLFASVSTIKAAYAQLQVAQAPYDPDSIESADQAVVSELKQLSVLKQSYLTNQLQSHASPASQPAVAAQIQEQRSLLKTYQITIKKLEVELQLKDSEILSLQAELLVSEKQSRALGARLHPGRSLAALDDLHLSGLSTDLDPSVPLGRGREERATVGPSGTRSGLGPSEAWAAFRAIGAKAAEIGVGIWDLPIETPFHPAGEKKKGFQGGERKGGERG